MANHALAESEKGDLEFTIQDSATHKAVACRIHLKDGSGKAQRADPLPFFRDHFVCAGNAQLRLPVGSYTFEIERGPEYLPRSGSADVRADATNKVAVQLERLVEVQAKFDDWVQLKTWQRESELVLIGVVDAGPRDVVIG